MATRNLVPRTTGEGGIGTAAKKWALAWINALIVATINALTLTAQTVGFTISGGTTSKTLTVSSDADTKDTIKGDGTAGRVLRSLRLAILNGTNAATIKVQTIAWLPFNGDVVAQVDNLGKGGSSGGFTLSADGSVLTIADSVISGDTVAVLLAYPMINQFTTSFNCYYYQDTGIRLSFSGDPNGGTYDLTAAVDTGGGTAYIHVLYVTSA